jgi:hypothetical protein
MCIIQGKILGEELAVAGSSRLPAEFGGVVKLIQVIFRPLTGGWG